MTSDDSKRHKDIKRTARKRLRDKDISDSSDDYDIGGKNAGKRRKDENEDSNLYLRIEYACPFYKYGERPGHLACAGAGWTNITRMLKHIYRIHARPIYCQWCHMIFDNQAGLELHIQKNIHQSTNSTGPPRGIRSPQLEALRTEVPDSLSDIRRWAKVYQILFPDTDSDDMPLPYYDHHDNDDMGSWSARRVEEVYSSDGPDVQHAAGTSRQQNRFVQERLRDAVSLDTEASEGNNLGFLKAKMKHTISADATACNAERHKLLFMALEHGSMTGLPRRGSS